MLFYFYFLFYFLLMKYFYLPFLQLQENNCLDFYIEEIFDKAFLRHIKI